MPNFRTAFPGKYLKSDDLAAGPIVATIARAAIADVRRGDTSERKLVVEFEDPGLKPVVLNVVNAEAIAEIARTDDIDRWPGLAVELYRDRTLFQGKRVPCVRIRRPRHDDLAEALPTIADSEF